MKSRSMLTRVSKRIIAIAVLISMIGSICLPKTTVFAEEAHIITGYNPFIEYRLDDKDGRFTIRTRQGVPQKLNDDEKPLIFERDDNPETSFTTFKIDGKEYIYGNSYYGKSKKALSVMNVNHMSTISTWEVDGVQIRQILEIIEDKEHINVGNVKIAYEIKNNSAEDKDVGSRILLDTQLGDNDASSFLVNSKQISTETVFEGENVPLYYRASDRVERPRIMAYGFLKGQKTENPTKVVFAHYETLATQKYDVNINPNLDFTRNSPNKGADSAVACYFGEKVLKPGESRIVQTYYGLGDFSHFGTNSPFQISMNTVPSVHLNEAHNGYEEKTIPVTVTIDNSLEKSVNMSGVKIKLNFEELYFDVEKEGDDFVEIKAIEKGEIVAHTFNIKPIPQTKYRAESIGVAITSNNSDIPAYAEKYILLPDKFGKSPEVQVQTVGPEKVYYEGYKKIQLKGKGFLTLKDKSKWQLAIKKIGGEKYEIPQENVKIISDELMEVVVYKDTFDKEVGGKTQHVITESGNYEILIEHSTREDINVAHKTIDFTDDIKYLAKEYGLLYIVKEIETNNGKDKIIYNIKTADTYEKYISDKNDNKLEVVYSIQGQIIERQKLGAKGNREKYYEIITNGEAAIINDVVQVDQGSEPILIEKVKDSISVNGSGALRIVNDFKFWAGDFYTYIIDEEDYESQFVINSDDNDEGKSNVELKFLHPLNKLSDFTSIFLDGFNLKINDVILLDEGASFGGGLEVEIPFTKQYKAEKNPNNAQPSKPAPPKKPVKPGEKPEGEKKPEDIWSFNTKYNKSRIDFMKNTISDIFLTPEEYNEKYNLAVGERTKLGDKRAINTEIQFKQKEAEKSEVALKKRKQRILSRKIAMMILSNKGIREKIIAFKDTDNMNDTEKASAVVDLVLESGSLVFDIWEMYDEMFPDPNKKDEDDDKNSSVGVHIDVKKVVFGRKYNDDFFSETVKYLGLDAQGGINVSMPFGTEQQHEKNQDDGISANVSINTFDGEYYFDAQVKVIGVGAKAIVSLVRLDDSEIRPKDIEIVGYFGETGIPIAPPVSITSLGGGAKNLVDVNERQPLTIVLMAGIKVNPVFQGNFRGEFSSDFIKLYGNFSLDFGDNDLMILESASIELQWVQPAYFSCGASIDIFDVIKGSASLYIGEKKIGNVYKFYFEGKAEVGVYIPSGLGIISGIKLLGAEFGVSTEKIWGGITIIGIDLGVTYVYGKKVKIKFADGQEYIDMMNVSNIEMPQSGLFKGNIDSKDEGTWIVGSNIVPIASTNTIYVDGEKEVNLHEVIEINDEAHSYKFNVSESKTNLMTIEYIEEAPEFHLFGPDGIEIPLVEEENYRYTYLSAENAEDGVERKYVSISLISPIVGEYTVKSNSVLVEGNLYEVKPLPKMQSISIAENQKKLAIDYKTSDGDEAMVSLFLVPEKEESSAGILLDSNLSGNSQSLEIAIPEGLKEGNYKVRATIQNANEGYDEILSETSFYINDPLKPEPTQIVKIVNEGNGLVEAEWKALDMQKYLLNAEEGVQLELKYLITVLDKDGNHVSGFANLQVENTSTILGQSYTGIIQDSEGQAKEVVYEMPDNADYQLKIETLIIERNAEGLTRYHKSEPIVSEIFHKRKPEPPLLDITILNDNKEIDDYFAVGTELVDINIESDQNVNFEVMLDNEHYLNIRESEDFQMIYELEEGQHILKVNAINAFGDTASIFKKIDVDTTPPKLMMESPLSTDLSEGATVAVKGITDADATVYINNEEIEVVNNQFERILKLDGQKLKNGINVSAVDQMGNRVDYHSEVIDNRLSSIEKIEVVEDSQVVFKGETKAIKVVGIDHDGNRRVIEPKNLVYTVIFGENNAVVNNAGEVRFIEKGAIGIKISYPITDEFELNTGLNLDIKEGIKKFELETNSVHAGKWNKITPYIEFANTEDVLENSIVNYEVIAGEELVTLEKNQFYAQKEGIIEIKGSFYWKGHQFTTRKIISIMPKEENSGNHNTSVYDESDTTDVLDDLLNDIYKKLLEEEGDIKIISAYPIHPLKNVKLSINGYGELFVPRKTFGKYNKIIAGVVRDESKFPLTGSQQLVSPIIELISMNESGYFKEPIDIYLSRLDKGKNDTKAIGLYTFNEKINKWVYVGQSERGMQIGGKIQHFSKYALILNEDGMPFKDVYNYWAKDSVYYLESLGIVNGEKIGKDVYFNPNNKMSRLELATILVRAYELLYGPINFDSASEKSLSKFSDKESIPEWAKEYAEKSIAIGLIKGVTDLKGALNYQGDKKVTRTEAFVMINRMMSIGMEENNAENKVDIDLTIYNDYSNIPEWAREDIISLISQNVVSGYKDRTIRPLVEVTRGEMAKLVSQWIDKQVNSNGQK